jgi:hypothetical protein
MQRLPVSGGLDGLKIQRIQRSTLEHVTSVLHGLRAGLQEYLAVNREQLVDRVRNRHLGPADPSLRRRVVLGCLVYQAHAYARARGKNHVQFNAWVQKSGQGAGNPW